MLLLFLSLSSRKKSNFIIRSDRHLLTKAIACVSNEKESNKKLFSLYLWYDEQGICGLFKRKGNSPYSGGFYLMTSN